MHAKAYKSVFLNNDFLIYPFTKKQVENKTPKPCPLRGFLTGNFG